MIVTIDSNVPIIPKMIALKMDASAKVWCSKLNLCLEKIKEFSEKHNNKPTIYYDTPISMSDSAEDYNFEQYAPHMINFLYLDYSRFPSSVARIMKNLRGMDGHVVIITNAKAYKRGHYTIDCGNCLDRDISDVLAGIMVVHLNKKRVVSEAELLELLAPLDSKRPNSADQIDSASKKGHTYRKHEPAPKLNRVAGSSKTGLPWENSEPEEYNVYNVLDARRPKEIVDCSTCEL